MKKLKMSIAVAGFVLMAVASTSVWAQEEKKETGKAAEPAAEAPAAEAQAEEIPPPPPGPGSKPGTIGGSIRSTGSFPGGTVTIKNIATGEVRTGPVAPQFGEYELKDLPPGTYDVTVVAEGFTEAHGQIEPGQGALDLQVRPLMGWEPALPIFSWMFHTRVGDYVRRSTWAVAYLEVFHLLGLTVLLGSSVAMGLRLSGIAMRSLPTSEVAKEVRPYMWGGLLLVVMTGLPILTSEAEKMFQSRPFELKMFFFALANIFQFGVVAFLARSKDDAYPILGKFAALLSVVFWYVVAWEGRAIAFF